MYRNAAGSSDVDLVYGECVMRFTHTYGVTTGLMDAVIFTPVTPPVQTAEAAATTR